MKFKSRKDIFFKVILFSSVLLLSTFIFLLVFIEGIKTPLNVFMIILIIFVLYLLISLYFNTWYELTKTELKYWSGVSKGSIDIAKIPEIVVGKTLYNGNKPALARNGLIIYTGKYDKIYISPETNELFIKKILELNDKIVITRS